jgi:hypothetical protein
MPSRRILGTTVMTAGFILISLLSVNAALADSSGVYSGDAQPQEIPQSPVLTPQEGNDRQLNPDWVEDQPGLPREASELSPEDNNKQLLNDAYQEKQAGLIKDDAAEDESQDSPPEDVPTAGYKMFILDDKGRVKQTMTSQ